MLKSDIAACSEVLARTGWLPMTPPEFSHSLLSHCRWRYFAAGSMIQHAGDRDCSMTGLARGTTAVTTVLSAPDTPMIHIAHPGVWIGYAPMFTPQARTLDVVARSDIIVAQITLPEVEALLAERPQWWRYFGALGVIYGNIAANIAGDLMIRDSKRRCAAALLRLANCRFADPEGAQQVEAAMTQDELAAVANLSRTSVGAILRELEQAGLIALGYRSVVLTAPRRLRAIVDGV